MAGDVNVGGIRIPILGVMWLASLVIIIVQYFGKISFGVIGIISWLVFLAGAVLFLLWVLSHFFG